MYKRQGEEDSKVIIELANTKHACRGAALTLAIYKILHPEQDIRSHKAEYENGFSARGVDHSVTVPFLIQKEMCIRDRWNITDESEKADMEINNLSDVLKYL